MTPASETPVKIEHKWKRGWSRADACTIVEDYYLVTFADGTSQEMGSVPNAWHEAVERASKKEAA